jgi:peptidoglycan hydrolase CwlO-like protein
MSTAGKVLIVLVMLTSLVWMILSSGVSQLNSNGNKKLNDLMVQAEKAEEQIKQAHEDILSLHDQTSSVQETTDHEVAVLHARQSDIEKARSQIQESLSRVNYQLAIAQETIDRGKTALQHRATEQQTEEQALAQAKLEVKDLTDRTGELMNQLAALRKDFQATYHTNLESLGKTR